MTDQRSNAWWADAVVYQIYVRSFADANGDGRGDLAGITRRLPYLAQLGVNAIWLTPCFPSPQRDHGYDVSDYFDIEPTYGTLDDFDRLVAVAKQHSINILMDVVPNHCSSQHAWFQAALESQPGSPERARFWFKDGRGESGELPPNNWRAIFDGPAWTRVTEADGTPGQWYLHTFTPWQPDFNWYHPDVVEHFDKMLRFWFDRGVEGFRVDAVPVLGKHLDLPDSPPVPVGLSSAEAWGYNIYGQFYPTAHDVWKHWRTLINNYEATHSERRLVTISEAYGPPEEVLKYMQGDEFHQSFAFDLMLVTWQAGLIRGAITDALDMLASVGATPAWTLNNHDTQRIVTRLGRTNADDPAAFTGNNLVYVDAPIDIDVGTRRARAAIALAAALPGALYLYYGEELGLEEVLDLPDDVREDPLFFNSNGELIGRDGCRVPLPWTIEPANSFGFSDCPPGVSSDAPWLPQPALWGALSVEQQEHEADSMLAWYRRVLEARGSLGGDLTWVDAGDRCVAFGRGDDLIVLNPSGQSVSIPHDLLGGRLQMLSSVASSGDVVPSNSCVWFRTPDLAASA
jgi:alpha-glucosidase